MKKFICIVGLLAILCTVCGCARQANTEEANTQEVHSVIKSAIKSQEIGGCHYESGDSFGEAHHVFACFDGNLKGKERSECMTVYLYYLCGYFAPDGEMRSGSAVPAAVVLNRAGDTWTVEQIWQPRDGAYYSEDLIATFPFSVYKQLRAFEDNHNENIEALETEIMKDLKSAE